MFRCYYLALLVSVATSSILFAQTPTITGQNSTPSTDEDTSVEILLSWLDVNWDGADPSDFDLNVMTPGVNYTAVGNVVTPATNYNGPLLVQVVVTNGITTSTSFDFTLSVTSIYDPTAITSQVNPSYNVSEDTQFTLTLSDLVINNIEGNPLTLEILVGSNYTFSDATVTPAANYSGPLTVNLRVDDGVSNSNTFGFQVTVNTAIDPPFIAGQVNPSYNVDEDTPFTLTLSDLIINNIEGNPLTLEILSGSNYTSLGTTITPAANYFGPLTVNLHVYDGVNYSNTFGFQAAANAINDAPTLNGIGDVSVNKNASTQNVPLSGITAGPFENQALTVNVANDNNALFNSLVVNYTSPGATGSIDITPNPNVFGTARFTITVTDNGLGVVPHINSTSTSFDFTILDVNYPPTFNPIGDVTINEDAPVQNVAITGISPGIGEQGAQTVGLSATSLNPTLIPNGNISIVHDNVSPTATLMFTPAANRSGVSTIAVRALDSGGEEFIRTFEVTVLEINDQPTLDMINNIAVAEDSPTQNIPLTNITAGTFESQTLTVTAVAADMSLFDNFQVNYTSPNTLGILSVTPRANAFGSTSVTVTVTDNGSNTPPHLNSITRTFTFTIDPMNDIPVITSQESVTIESRQSYTITFDDLSVTDIDNDYPDDFTLILTSGDNYSVSEANVTPDPDFVGELSIGVLVNDGQTNSNLFTFKITVNFVNVPPAITAQLPNPIQTNAGVPFNIEFSNLSVTDPDNDYWADFTMAIQPGANYTASEMTVTPAVGYVGTLSVGVRVNDGTDNSNTFNVQVQVLPVNDPPRITSQLEINVDENTPFDVLLSHITVDDDDSDFPDDFTVEVLTGTNYSFASAMVTPTTDFTGILSVNIRVSDGKDFSPMFPLIVNVNFVNEPPTTVGFQPVTVNEEHHDAVVINLPSFFDDREDGPEDLTYQILSNSHPQYFESASINSSHQLVFVVAANRFGTANITVRATDSGGLMVQSVLTVTINEVNDLPSFNHINDIVIAENSAAVVINVNGISPGPFESGSVQLTATSSNVEIVSVTFSHDGTSSNGTITIVPADNRSGNVTITALLVDTGLERFSQPFTVTVEQINDAPTLNSLADLTIPEDSPLQEIPLTGITAGPFENQVLDVKAVSNNPDLFETLAVTYQSPETNGVLRVKTKPNAFGVATVTVSVTDNGSSTLPNRNYLDRTFILTITPENDSPEIISRAGTVAIVGEVYSYLIEAVDVDVADMLTISAMDKPGWLSLVSQGNGIALLQGIPPAGSGGIVNIVLGVKDSHNATGGQKFSLVVNTRPAVNDFSITLNEDEPKIVGTGSFITAFFDVDGDTLDQIRIVRLPSQGQLLIGGQQVSINQQIDRVGLNNLIYSPNQDYFGRDTVAWIGSDSLSYSLDAAMIFFTIQPVNDPPIITALEDELLEFTVGNEPILLSAEFGVADVDDEYLEGAQIGFRNVGEALYVPDADILIYDSPFTPAIAGSFSSESGILTLTGTATVADYVTAIRSIRYDNLTDLFFGDPLSKTVYYVVTDGTAYSAARERKIKVNDGFEELDIPNAFSPNSDGANETWSIANLDRHQEAIVKVYNVRGLEVYSSSGKYLEWDGQYNGKMLPSETYFYTIDLNLPVRKKTYHGAITILR